MEFREIVLLLCGNFNPITNMHLRMFEIARDHLTDLGYSVYKGLISPCDKNINEQSTVSIEHRIAMIKYALNSSNWIQLSTWHCEQFDLPTTLAMLQHHQSRFEYAYKSNFHDKLSSKNCRFVVKLLCGADILFYLKNLEAVDDLHDVLNNHGIVVISRSGFDIDSIIDENDVLWAHRKNIVVVNDKIENQISSRKIRKAVARGRSIKYLVNDAVEHYISLHNLYAAPDSEYKHLDTSKRDLFFYEKLDSFRECAWPAHSHYEYSSSTETLTSALPKKSKLSHKGRSNKQGHFRNIDKSKLIGIPVTEDGMIQIIADKETNL